MLYPKQQLLQEIPDQVLKNITSAIVDNYQAAYDLCKKHYPDNKHARQVLPFVRAKHIDTAVFNTCKGILNTKTESNEANNWSYTAIRTESFLLTIARGDQPDSCPRPSKYRQKLAQKHNPYITDMFQADLDETLMANLPSDELYAVIIHKPSADDPSIPEFVRIVFPTADYTASIGSGIDLLDKYGITPTLIDEPIDHENISDDIDGFLKQSLHELKTKKINDKDSSS